MSESDITADVFKDDATTTDCDHLQLVSFEIGGEEYAIPIQAVQEINRMMPMTRVPHSSADVEGVINLRGRIIPVIDLRRRFGLQHSAGDVESRIVVVEVGEDKRVIGFTVDRVHEVIRLDASRVDPPPTLGKTVDCDMILGIGKLEDRYLILLDLGRLFAHEDVALAKAV